MVDKEEASFLSKIKRPGLGKFGLFGLFGLTRHGAFLTGILIGVLFCVVVWSAFFEIDWDNGVAKIRDVYTSKRK